MKLKLFTALICGISAFSLYADNKVQSNVLFAEDFEAPAKEWVIRGGYAVKAEEGVKGSKGLSLVRPDASTPYTFCKYKVKGFKPGHKYRLSMMIRVDDLKYEGRTIPSKAVQVAGFDFYDNGKYLGSAYLPIVVRNGNADWKLYHRDFTVPGNVKEASVCFFLRKPYSCARMAWDDIKVEEIGTAAAAK